MDKILLVYLLEHVGATFRTPLSSTTLLVIKYCISDSFTELQSSTLNSDWARLTWILN